MGADDVVREYRDLYLELAGHVRVDEAVELCLDLLDKGMGPEDITLRLLQPAQHEVGQRWALGSWSVAQEHAASAVTDTALAALSAAVPARPHGDPVVVACPQTEWHGLAARMVTQLLRWRGVAADHVGTLASDSALEELLTERRPRALALSCTMTSALPGVARAVDVATHHGTAVLGGGLGFGPQGRYASAVGVTTWDTHVSQVARRLACWDGTGYPGHRHAVPEPIAYRRLVRHRRDIAEELANRLVEEELAPDGAEILRDAADQVVALALAAARTGHASILDEGVGELVAVLTERPEPISAIAARLPVAAHAVVDRYRGALTAAGPQSTSRRVDGVTPSVAGTSRPHSAVRRPDSNCQSEHEDRGTRRAAALAHDGPGASPRVLCATSALRCKTGAILRRNPWTRRN